MAASQINTAKRSRFEKLPALSFTAAWALIGTFAAACSDDGVGQTHVTDDEPTPRTQVPKHVEAPTIPDERTSIVFSGDSGRYTDIYVMDPDGRNLIQLTKTQATDQSPKWSPDRSQIAFASALDGDFEIFVMDADGSNLRQITDNEVNDGDPSWFPSGDRIAFASGYDTFSSGYDTFSSGYDTFSSGYDIVSEIYTVKTDGSELSRLTINHSSDTQPDVSPDGSTIIYVNDSIYLNGSVTVRATNSDGSNNTLLIDDRRRLINGIAYSDPVWSPGGDRIALVKHHRFQTHNCKTVMVMESDGTGLIAIGSYTGSCEIPEINSLGYFDDIVDVSWSPTGDKVAFLGAFRIIAVTFGGGSYTCRKSEILSTATDVKSVTKVASGRRGQCAGEEDLPFIFTEFDW